MANVKIPDGLMGTVRRLGVAESTTPDHLIRHTIVLLVNRAEREHERARRPRVIRAPDVYEQALTPLFEFMVPSQIPTSE